MDQPTHCTPAAPAPLLGRSSSDVPPLAGEHFARIDAWELVRVPQGAGIRFWLQPDLEGAPCLCWDVPQVREPGNRLDALLGLLGVPEGQEIAPEALLGARLLVSIEHLGGEAFEITAVVSALAVPDWKQWFTGGRRRSEAPASSCLPRPPGGQGFPPLRQLLIPFGKRGRLRGLWDERIYGPDGRPEDG